MSKNAKQTIFEIEKKLEEELPYPNFKKSYEKVGEYRRIIESIENKDLLSPIYPVLAINDIGFMLYNLLTGQGGFNLLIIIAGIFFSYISIKGLRLIKRRKLLITRLQRVANDIFEGMKAGKGIRENLRKEWSKWSHSGLPSVTDGWEFENNILKIFVDFNTPKITLETRAGKDDDWKKYSFSSPIKISIRTNTETFGLELDGVGCLEERELSFLYITEYEFDESSLLRMVDSTTSIENLKPIENAKDMWVNMSDYNMTFFSPRNYMRRNEFLEVQRLVEKHFYQRRWFELLDKAKEKKRLEILSLSGR